MLIGLNGKKQAGKDTAHARIVERLPDATVERASFADKLYESAAAALGIDVEFLQRWKSDPEAGIRLYDGHANGCADFTFREFLQHYGTEAHRQVFGDNFWVDNVDLSHDRKIVVVTDVRFDNEAQAVWDAGGSVVRVEGPTEIEEAGDGHASERPLSHIFIDHVLDNSVRDDDFASLDSQVLELVLRLLKEERQ